MNQRKATQQTTLNITCKKQTRMDLDWVDLEQKLNNLVRERTGRILPALWRFACSKKVKLVLTPVAAHTLKKVGHGGVLCRGVRRCAG